MTTDQPEAANGRTRLPGYLAAGVGMLALAVIGVFYLSSGLVAPLWAVAGLVAVWVVLVVIGIRWFRRHPFRVLILPLAAVALWVAVLTLGERLLGWTA